MTLPSVTANPRRGWNPRWYTWRLARRLSSSTNPPCVRAPTALANKPAAVIGSAHVESNAKAAAPLRVRQSVHATPAAHRAVGTGHDRGRDTDAEPAAHQGAEQRPGRADGGSLERAAAIVSGHRAVSDRGQLRRYESRRRISR